MYCQLGSRNLSRDKKAHNIINVLWTPTCSFFQRHFLSKDVFDTESSLNCRLAAGSIEKVCCLEESSSTALVNQSGTCQQTIDKFIFKLYIFIISICNSNGMLHHRAHHRIIVRACGCNSLQLMSTIIRIWLHSDTFIYVPHRRLKIEM